MRTVLMYDPSAEGEKIASWLEEKDNINVIFDKKYGIFTQHLYSANYDLILTEIDPETVEQDELWKVTRPQTENIFHVGVTNCKDLFKIAYAEVNGVKKILFKPIEQEEFFKVINETICGKKHFLIAAEENRAKYLSTAVTTLGHFAYNVQKDYELNRILLGKPIDFIVYDESFDISRPDDFFKRISSRSRNGLRSLAILKRTPDPVLKTTLEHHRVERILPYDVRGEIVSHAIMEFLQRQPVLESEKEMKKEKQEEEVRLELQKKADDDKKRKEDRERKEREEKEKREAEKRRREAGKMSLIRFVKEMETKFYDQKMIEPVKDYMRTRSPVSGEEALDLLRSSKGQPVLLLFSEVFPRADSHFKEFILDMFAEVNNANSTGSLLAASKDDDSDIRFMALLGLQGRKDKRLKSFVAVRLFDENQKVRKTAAKLLEEEGDIHIVKGMVDAIRKFNDDSLVKSLAFIIENKVDCSSNMRYFMELYSFVPRDIKEVIINELVKTGSRDVIPFLLREMKSKDDMLSRLAVDGLNNLKEPLALPGMITYLKVNDAFYIQDVALNLLKSIKSKKHIPLLAKVVAEAPSSLVETAIEIVKNMGGKESLILILRALRNPAPSVKMAAIDALVLRKKKYIVPSLVHLLDDSNAIVRDRSQEVLKGVVDKNDIDTLLTFFKKAKTDEARETIAEFLRSFISDKDPSAIEKLMRKDGFHLLLDTLRQKGYSLGEYTTSVLGDKFATEEAFDAIIKTLYSNSQDSRAEALLALGKVGRPEAVPHILKVLNDETWFIRRNAIEALKSYKIPKTVVYVERLMNDENAGVRLSSVEFIVMMKAKYREKALLWAVAEESSKVLRYIPKLLPKFKDQELAEVYVEKMDAVEPVVRMHAARKLLEMLEKPDFEYLMKRIEDKNWRVRLFSFMIICDRNKEKAKSLVPSFAQDPAPEIRKELPILFKEILNEASLSEIINFALNDEDLQVRKNAVKMLPSFEIDDKMKTFLHDLLEKESSNSGLMEIGFAIDIMDYELPREVMVKLENKFPNELKQIFSAIAERHRNVI